MNAKEQETRADFEWQIGDNIGGQDVFTPLDAEWSDDIPLEAHDEVYVTRRSSRNLWIGLLLITSTVVVAIALLFQRANVISADAQQQVQSSYALLQKALQDSDRDLAASLLTQRDARWLRQQNNLLAQRLLIDRRGLGLILQSTEPQRIAVLLSDDLNTAQVNVDYRYTLGEQDDAETVMLQLSFPYQLDRGRWVLTAPRGDFREQRQTYLGARLNLSFFERDEKISLRLADDLDTLVAHLCATPNGVACPDNISVQLRFEDDPLSLTRAETQWFNPSDPFSAGASASSRRTVFVRLPTPALVGLPIDEAAYQALYRAYATQVALVVIDQFTTTLRYAPDTYDALLRQSGLDPLYPAKLADRPIPLQQDVRLLCGSGVYRYDTTNGIWLKEGQTTEFSQALALPDGNFILASTQKSHVRLWKDGRERIVWQRPSGRVFGFGTGDHSGRFQTIYTAPSPASGPSEISLIDLEDCRGAECASWPSQGYPIWSPNGSHTLIITLNADKPYLILGDALGQTLTEIGIGAFPVWLDDHTYAYVRPISDTAAPRAPFEIVIAHISDVGLALDPPLQVLSTDTLLDDLVAQQNATISVLGLNRAVTGDPSLLSVWVSVETEAALRQSTLLLFDWRIARVIDRVQLTGEYPPPQLSPNGHWLVELDRAGSATLLRFHALQSERTFAYPMDSATGLDWSRDGRWLLTWNNTEVSLFAPEADYKKLIASRTGGCSVTTWVDRLP